MRLSYEMAQMIWNQHIRIPFPAQNAKQEMHTNTYIDWLPPHGYRI